MSDFCDQDECEGCDRSDCLWCSTRGDEALEQAAQPTLRHPDLDALEQKAAQHARFGAYAVATYQETMKLIVELRTARASLRAADRLAHEAEEYLGYGHAISNEDAPLEQAIAQYTKSRVP